MDTDGVTVVANSLLQRPGGKPQATFALAAGDLEQVERLQFNSTKTVEEFL